MASTIIKDVKVWKNSQKTETRIYAHTTDNREGCYYFTGNQWHEKKSYDGALSAEEWQEVRQIALYDGAWHTVYESEIHGSPRRQSFAASTTSVSHSSRCPDCGGYDCGSNCKANAPEAPHRNRGYDYADDCDRD